MVCFGFFVFRNIFSGNLIENASMPGAKTRKKIETVYKYYVKSVFSLQIDFSGFRKLQIFFIDFPFFSTLIL